MKDARKKCRKCEAEMNAILEVCPVCREKQPVMKPWVIWFFLAAFLLAWAAFYRF